jgi:hypothetical protein
MEKEKTYTVTGDQHLCVTWVITSTIEVPITGKGKKKDAFWKSILTTFQCLSGPVEEPRTVCSLQCHWAAINKDAKKFNGIFAQLKSNPRSGWTWEKYKEEALKLHREEVKEDFKFLGCWTYLKEKLKWVNTSGFICPAVVKRTVTEAAAPPLLQTPSIEVENSTIVDVPGVKPERPMGQKAAKIALFSLSDEDYVKNEQFRDCKAVVSANG